MRIHMVVLDQDMECEEFALAGEDAYYTGVGRHCWYGRDAYLVAAFRERDVRGVPQEEALLRTMFALWAEPRVCESAPPRVSPLNRVSARVAEAARGVRVVDVREHDEPERVTSDGARRYRPYDHRFIVSGHWREQPCGPNLDFLPRLQAGDSYSGWLNEALRFGGFPLHGRLRCDRLAPVSVLRRLHGRLGTRQALPRPVC